MPSGGAGQIRPSTPATSPAKGITQQQDRPAAGLDYGEVRGLSPGVPEVSNTARDPGPAVRIEGHRWRLAAAGTSAPARLTAPGPSRRGESETTPPPRPTAGRTDARGGTAPPSAPRRDGGSWRSMRLLAKWNAVYNLTACANPGRWWSAICSTFGGGMFRFMVLDIGTGAGLPGIPLALVAPIFTSCCSTQPEDASRLVAAELGLANVEVAGAGRETPGRAQIRYHLSRASGALLICWR